MIGKCEKKLKVLLVGTQRTCEKAASLKFENTRLISFPVLDTCALNKVDFPQSHYEWLILTSPAAVLHFSKLDSKPEYNKVAVIGPSTEKAAKAANMHVDFLPEKYDAQNCCAELLNNHTNIRSALFPCSTLADSTIEESFNEAGLNIDRVNLYQPIVLNSRELPDYDAIAFFSSSSVETFKKLYGTPETKKIAAIGKKAAKSVKECFQIDALVPSKSTSSDTIQTLL